MFRAPSIRSTSTSTHISKISTLRTSIPKRYTTDGVWSKREIAAETVEADRHDRELIKKLQEKNKMAQSNKSEPKSEPKSEVREDDRKGYVTTTEFQGFRKQMVQKLRALEDELHDKKYDK